MLDKRDESCRWHQTRWECSEVHTTPNDVLPDAAANVAALCTYITRSVGVVRSFVRQAMRLQSRRAHKRSRTPKKRTTYDRKVRIGAQTANGKVFDLVEVVVHQNGSHTLDEHVCYRKGRRIATSYVAPHASRA